MVFFVVYKEKWPPNICVTYYGAGSSMKKDSKCQLKLIVTPNFNTKMHRMKAEFHNTLLHVTNV